MVRLHDHLAFFVRHKLATDPEWQKLRVVYSGYNVPGEGEHKIMEFIRVQVRNRLWLHTCTRTKTSVQPHQSSLHAHECFMFWLRLNNWRMESL